jgi:tetratricopeptide (TPR) repeat protein
MPWFFPVALGGVVTLCGAFALLRHSLFRARIRAFARAIEAEDVGAAEAAVAAIARVVRGPQGAVLLDLLRASLPLVAERFAEGRAKLAALEYDRLHPAFQLFRDNDLAWAMAHDGAAHEALPLAERAVAAPLPAGVGAEMEGGRLSTLGVVQLKAGRADEARATLERALALGGSPRKMAARAFYLGEALLELGHREEAAAAYDRAVRAKHDSIYGKKAGAALATLAAEQPYRG